MATLLRQRSRSPRARDAATPAIVGAVGAIVATFALAAGHVVGAGVPAVGATGFLLLAAWCAGHRRADLTLAGLGLYLGLLDGYIKLRTGSPFVTLGRDVLVAAIAGGALLRALSSERRLALPPLGGLVLAFAAVVVVELFNPSAAGLAAGLGGLRQHLEFVPLFFLGYAFVRTERQLETLLFVLVLCAAVGGGISYVQSTLTPQEFADWGVGYRERILGTGAFSGAGRVAFDVAGNTSVRPFGLGSDAGAGATAAALALPALLALIASSRGMLRLAMVPLSVGIALATVTSGSRAATIAVVVSALAMALIAAASKNAVRVLIGLALGLGVAFIVVQQLGSDNTAAERSRSVLSGEVVTKFSEERGGSVRVLGEYALDYPLGLGVGTVGPAAGALSEVPASEARLNSETQWNFLVLETGLAGLAVFLALNGALLGYAFTRIRRVEDWGLRLQLAALAAPLAALLIAGFAGPTTASVPAAPYFWLVSGVLSFWLIGRYRSPSTVS